VEPLQARLWLTTQNALDLIDANGAVLQTTDLRTVGLHPTQGLALEPTSLSYWLGAEQHLGEFGDNGQWLGNLSVDGEIKALGMAPFFVSPTVSFLSPPDGVLTNNPRPMLRLGLGASCDGVACSAGSAYLDLLSLAASLNGQDIGKLFSVTAGEATYSPPTRLPEGVNTLTAQVKDKFGHNSDQLIAHFAIDTIPPKFLSINPADGSTVMSPAVTIQGVTDDPTSNVMLLDATGQVVSLASGANFSFAVNLSPGLNVFSLVARDPAGNETTAVLHLSYVTVTVTLENPLPNATLDSTTLAVNGTLQGPANTGITVNGVVAMVYGNRFFANLDLDPGVNTLTITATTPDGTTVTKTVTVTVTASAPDPIQVSVEPQSGVAPLPAQFTIMNNSGLGIATIEADFDGNGTTDFTTTDPTAPIAYTYPNPGVYPASIRVTDSQGMVHVRTLYVVVNDPAQMDAFFRGIWNGMNQALIRGDATTALSYLNAGAQQKYQPVFQRLLPQMPAIIASYSPLERTSITEDIGEYGVVRPYNGGNHLYLIYFLKGADGVWRLDSM
jgi:hypothetical protein